MPDPAGPAAPEPAAPGPATPDPAAPEPAAPESAAPEPAAPVMPRRAWTLRLRLLVSMMAIFTLVCLALGAATVASLRADLIGQVDDQLKVAAHRSVGLVRPGPGSDGEPPEFLRSPGQRAGVIGAEIIDGSVAAIGRVGQGEFKSLSPADTQVLLASASAEAPKTVDLPGLGSYRVLASAGPGDVVVVQGIPLAEAEATTRGTMLRLAGIILAGLILAAFAVALIVRRSLAPLRRVAATAARVSELPLDRGESVLDDRVGDADTDVRTEVGQVGAAVNRMLEHIDAALASRHASETQVRRFVADASHELRTPLATIHGYAELTRPLRDEVPGQVAQALERIEAGADRMSDLVDDLLLLARLESGRPLEIAEVDLSALVVGAVSDAHAAGPDHRWTLDLPDEPVMVSGDEARLHQVIGNLLTNARIHTPAGSTVETILRATPSTGASSAGGGGRALILVRDDGPGIDPALLPHVFDRFARGDSARSRAFGSSGLGLSIVAAVVEALGGEAGVESSPGGAGSPGRTEFRISLPLVSPSPRRPPGALPPRPARPPAIARRR